MNTENHDQIKLLLVDDKPENLLALKSVLCDMGLELITARSGKEALRHCLAQEFAAILLDVQMPEMDGFETAALIRQREKSQHTPIIFLTAFGKAEEQVFHGYCVGAVDYILKPFVPEILKAKTAIFVDLHKKTKQIERQAALLTAANKELEAHVLKIEQLNRDLEVSNKELEAFSYSASHDLRAPLRSIEGFGGMLLEEYADKLDEQGKDYIRRITTASRDMARLIEDMLRLARVTRAEIKRQTVNLGQLAKKIIAELRETQPERKVKFIAPPELVVTGDARLLRVALENLLSNAWKYTAKQPEPRIEMGVAQHERKPAYFVRDNGAGFNMAYAHKLFGAFQRLHSAAEFEGTGVGLATVQRIIHRHGGKVWAEAETGKGATFWFTIGLSAV